MATEMLCLPRPLCWRGRLFSYIPNLQSAIIGSSTSSSSATATLRVRCSVATDTPSLPTERRSANFQPTIWSYEKLQALENNLAVETYKDKAKLLEGEVKSIIQNETDVVSLLELIDSVQRLGMGYRFRSEIEKSLDKLVALGGLTNEAIKSLHATALGFRLLRQHGFQVSQDVFDKFKDETGKFRPYLGEDVEGLLSLYEASYLAMEGEDVLEEAKAFAVSHLKDLKEKSGSVELAKQISHALEHPLHHRIDRQEARWSIEEFSKKGGVNEAVLELAVLDFNVVQHVLQRDIGDMSKWWSVLDLASKLSFSRDRLMESFFWSVGMFHEPQYGSGRKAITKVFQLVTTIDDVYDVYGTQEELVLFTDAVERWNLDAIKDLPEYMKICFLALYNTANEMAYEILKEQGEVAIPYLKKAWSDLCKAFFQEAKWVHDKATPSFDEYLDNAWRSVSGACMLIHGYFMLGQGVTQKELDHLQSYHELLRLPSIIFRLCNDLATSSAEIERGETVNSISCYMNQAGVSEDEAREYIDQVINDTWKKINKHLVEKSTPFSEPFIETAINLARISHVQYQHGDGHGAPDVKAKGRIKSLIIEPVSMANQ